MAKLPEDVAAKTSGWEIPDGLYEMVFVHVETTNRKGELLTGKESGVPFWNWIYEFPEDANGGRWARRQLKNNISTGDTSTSMRADAFAAIGLDPSEDTDEVDGKVRVIAKVETEEWKGRKEAKVVATYPLGTFDLGENTAPVSEDVKAKATARRAKAAEEEAANF